MNNLKVPELFSFVFEVTRECNHTCRHCYNVWKIPGNNYPVGELDTDNTIAMLEKMIAQTGARLVTISGGEPFLRPDIFTIIDYLAGRKIAINLITNGSLLTEEVIGRLLPDKVSIFELPLLSAEREIHDRMSGNPGAFDRVTMAIANLKAARQRVVGVFVATRDNQETWEKTFKLAVALGLDGIMFNRFNPGGCGVEFIEELQLSPAELTRALDTAAVLSDKYVMPVSCSIAMPPCLIDTKKYEKIGFGFCAAGTERAYYTLDPIGNIRPCNHSPRIIGNLRENDFALIYNASGNREFLAAMPSFCGGCKHERVCQGGCKAAAEACNGDVASLEPFLSAYQHDAKRIS